MTTADAATELAGHGVAVLLPRQWEGRIYQRAVPAAPAASPATASHAAAAGPAYPHPTGWPGERTHPVMHLANFALPASRGDYGTGAVERMGAAHIFIALLEFGSDCLGTALYEPRGLPRVSAGQFNPNGMQRRVAGQAGFQHFFTERNRPFCLYVVLGSHRQAVPLTEQVNAVLDQIEVSP